VIEKHFCYHGEDGEMVPVWKDGTDGAKLKAWLCEKCLAWDVLRPGEETITRRDYERTTAVL